MVSMRFMFENIQITTITRLKGLNVLSYLCITQVMFYIYSLSFKCRDVVQNLFI